MAKKSAGKKPLPMNPNNKPVGAGQSAFVKNMKKKNSGKK